MNKMTEPNPPSKGSDLSMGLSSRESFKSTDPSSLGQGRKDMDQGGKPNGPMKKSADRGTKFA